MLKIVNENVTNWHCIHLFSADNKDWNYPQSIIMWISASGNCADLIINKTSMLVYNLESGLFQPFFLQIFP